MITDGLVVTGSSSLSRSSLELKEVSNSNLQFNKEENSITLKTKNRQQIPIVNDKSYIKTDNNYLIYSEDKKTLLTVSDFLSGTPIQLTTNTPNYKYTFCLNFSESVELNTINLVLNNKTKSYPLISEIYIINNSNKKEYLTILNTSTTSYNMDENRVKDNNYNILFDNISTNTIYISLEDKDDVDLILESLNCYKHEYEVTGEVVFGPVVSTYPILKASLEASGDTNNAEFYISHNKEDWVQVVLASEISKTNKLSKIIAYNTVSSQSYKTSQDVKELYLKVKVTQKESNITTNKNIVSSDNFYSNAYTYKTNNVNVSTVYKTDNNLFFGGSSYQTSLTITNTQAPQISYYLTDGIYKVKGFLTTNQSVTTKDSLNNVTTKSNYLKVNGTVINATDFNPTTATVYGYVVKTLSNTYNTLTEGEVVLPLYEEYSKDVYTIRQNNKEIKIDLSLGFITSSISVLFIVAPNLPVTLHDSTGKEILKLTPFLINDITYVSLIKDGLFIEPISINGFVFNPMYPLLLNNENEYGLLDSKFNCIAPLLQLDSYHSLYKEKIETTTQLSKENGNTITLVNSNAVERYTQLTEEYVKAYTKSRAIKLKNKHIKKGTLRITIK